jgi:hypothetical protein
MKFNATNSDIALIADRLAIPFTNALLGEKLPPEQFTKKLNADTEKYVKETIAKQVADQIEVKTALKVKERYPDWNVSQRELSKYAINKGYALNDAQREKTSEIVALAVTETMKHPGNKALDANSMANLLEFNVGKKLRENQSFIEGKDNSIDYINRRWMGLAKDGDIFGDIAKGFADAVRKNEGDVHTQLKQAQSLLQGGKPVALNEEASKSNLASIGVTGGIEYSGDPQALAGGIKTNGNTGRSIGDAARPSGRPGVPPLYTA